MKTVHAEQSVEKVKIRLRKITRNWSTEKESSSSCIMNALWQS